MTEDAAAWVRDHVWTKAMRKDFDQCPGHFLFCACQGGRTTYCVEGQHAKCTSDTPLISTETAVLKRGGAYGANFAEPYWHRNRTGYTDRTRSRYANVWLADRVCRWRCPCDCHPPEPQRVAAPTQLALLSIENPEERK